MEGRASGYPSRDKKIVLNQSNFTIIFLVESCYNIGVTYLFPFLISLFFLLILIRFQSLFNILDRPNPRSSHLHPLPRTGGIAFISSLFLTLVIFYPDALSPLTLAAFVWVFLLGLYDDIRGSSAYFKILMIMAAVIALYLQGITIDNLGQFFNWNLSLGWLSLPFTMLVVGGLTNAINLIDGLDNLAGGGIHGDTTGLCLHRL